MKKLILSVFCVLALVIETLACAALTKSGKQCKRAPSPGSQYCWQHGGTTKAQRAAGMTDADVAKNRCKATTKAGSQCSRQAQSGSQYCWQHAGASDDNGRSGATPAATSQEDDPAALSDGKCTAITKKGTRCKFRAQPGSTKCWMHQ